MDRERFEGQHTLRYRTHLPPVPRDRIVPDPTAFVLSGPRRCLRDCLIALIPLFLSLSLPTYEPCASKSQLARSNCPCNMIDV